MRYNYILCIFLHVNDVNLKLFSHIWHEPKIILIQCWNKIIKFKKIIVFDFLFPHFEFRDAKNSGYLQKFPLYWRLLNHPLKCWCRRWEACDMVHMGWPLVTIPTANHPITITINHSLFQRKNKATVDNKYV